MKILTINAKLRLHVSDDTTDEQIAAMVRNASSEAEPSLEVLDSISEHMMNVGSHTDVETLQSSVLYDADVWVDTAYEVIELDTE